MPCPFTPGRHTTCYFLIYTIFRFGRLTIYNIRNAARGPGVGEKAKAGKKNGDYYSTTGHRISYSSFTHRVRQLGFENTRRRRPRTFYMRFGRGPGGIIARRPLWQTGNGSLTVQLVRVIRVGVNSLTLTMTRQYSYLRTVLSVNNTDGDGERGGWALMECLMEFGFFQRGMGERGRSNSSIKICFEKRSNIHSIFV